MGFILPDILIESVIREGLLGLKQDPTVIDNVFSTLDASYIANKYGQKEIEKIKTILEKQDIRVVHSYYDVDSSLPCVSIQLSSETENRQMAHLDDFEDDVIENITDPSELAALVVLSGVTVSSYEENDSILWLDAGTNLSNVYPNMLFVDNAGSEFLILAVDDTNKLLVIESGATPIVTTPCAIKSAIDYTQTESRGIITDVTLTLGIHTKEPLFTKYLYLLIKFILLSRKKDLISRCFVNLTFSGSDFHRDMQYQGNHVFTRFLTINGKIEDSWSADMVTPITNIDTIILVDKDIATTEDLGMTSATVRVGIDSQDDQ